MRRSVKGMARLEDQEASREWSGNGWGGGEKGCEEMLHALWTLSAGAFMLEYKYGYGDAS
jgi:hypothetical protein